MWGVVGLGVADAGGGHECASMCLPIYVCMYKYVHMDLYFVDKSHYELQGNQKVTYLL